MTGSPRGTTPGSGRASSRPATAPDAIDFDLPLTRAECLRLLHTAPVGRLGLSVGALPVILPVNYTVDGDRILFGTGVGTKLGAALGGTVVCFEVDGIEVETRSGWSVLVTGRASVLSVAEAAEVELDPWTSQTHDHVVAVSIDLVSGRWVNPSKWSGSQSGTAQRRRVPDDGAGPTSNTPPSLSAR